MNRRIAASLKRLTCTTEPHLGTYILCSGTVYAETEANNRAFKSEISRHKLVVLIISSTKKVHYLKRDTERRVTRSLGTSVADIEQIL